VRLSSQRELPLQKFDGHLQNRAEIQRAAAGRGLISAASSTRVVRRAPMLARIGKAHVPSLAAEMIRVATGASLLHVIDHGGDAIELRIGEVTIPLQADGSMWIRHGRHDPSKFVSAEDVLAGKASLEPCAGGSC
jgi:adenylate cyclase